MNSQEYLNMLKTRLAHYYDEKPLSQQVSPEFILAAELNAADEGYFLIPDLKTYSVRHNEYLYVQRFSQPLTLNLLEPYLDFAKKAMSDLKTTTEHMSSLFTLVFVCEAGIAAQELPTLTKIKQHKDYCFTLKGWSDLALYFVDISSQTVHYNKAGAKNSQLFAFPENK